MKVILSLDAVHFPLTGIGRYTYELARNLKKISEIEQLRFFSGRRFVQDIPQQVEGAQAQAQSTSSSSQNFKRKLIKLPGVAAVHDVAVSIAKQQVLRNYADYIFHGPNFDLPPCSGPSVCTIHDLSVFTWPHCHPPARVRKMREEIAHTLKTADMLITDTEFTRHEVAEYFSWPLDKIRAVPLAGSGDFFPRTSEQAMPALQKFALNFGSYSLFVGTIEPRKNLEVLLEAYRLLPVAMRQQWPLVIVGHKGWRSEALHARIELAQAEGWVHYLGFVDASDLPLIFAAARLFVFPSLYEGFGLPVLEAMASGIPVVCSNASTLPEVAGDAAAMCTPQDVEALTQLIMAGLEDEFWRNEAVRKGLLQSAQFSWQRCAQDTAAVYKSITT